MKSNLKNIGEIVNILNWKRNLLVLVTLILISLSICSCDNGDKKVRSFPRIMDEVGLLTKIEKDSLIKLDILGANMVIYTIDTLMVDDIKESLPSIWDKVYQEHEYKNEGTILVVGSREPNCAYIFYDEANTNLPVLVNGYASKDYFSTQINDSLTTNKKIFEMVRFAMNSYIANNNIINLLKSEIIGWFYDFTTPSNKWYYSLFMSKFQALFLFITKYLGFWIGVFVTCIFFYTLNLFVSSYLKRLLLVYANNGQIMKIIIIGIVYKILPLILYIIPIAFGIISILHARCICGVEFAANIMEIESVSIKEAYSFFISDLSGRSMFLALSAATIFIVSTWDEYYIHKDNFILVVLCVPIIMFSCISMPNAVNWVVIVMSLLNTPNAFRRIIQIDGFSCLYYSQEELKEIRTRQKINRHHIYFIFLLLLFCIVSIIVCLIRNIPNFEMPIIG